MRAGLVSALSVVLWLLAGTPFAAEMIGREGCVTCHTPMDHSAMLSHDMQDEDSCEMCHGPGSDHMDTESSKDIRTFKEKSLDALDEANDVCLTCHALLPLLPCGRPVKDVKAVRSSTASRADAMQ